MKGNIKISVTQFGSFMWCMGCKAYGDVSLGQAFCKTHHLDDEYLLGLGSDDDFVAMAYIIDNFVHPQGCEVK